MLVLAQKWLDDLHKKKLLENNLENFFYHDSFLSYIPTVFQIKRFSCGFGINYIYNPIVN